MQARTTIRLSRRTIVGFVVTTVASASLLVLLFVRLQAASQVASSTPTFPLVGHTAPDFAITTWNGQVGQRVHLAALKGHPVVVNFWASWCDSCQEEQANLQAAWQKYQGSGVEFIGIAFRDKQDAGAAYLRQQGVTYPCGPDSGGTTPIDYSVSGVPETVFIDKYGVVTSKFSGPIDSGSLDQAIQGLLK